MIGIIPAAGLGTRLGLPYPKELLPITWEGNRIVTVIESNIRQLAGAGVRRAIIVIRPEKQIIQQYLGDYLYGVSLSYVNQETMNSREGLPDAILSARNDSDMVFMLMADTYLTDANVVRELRNAMNVKREASVGVATWNTDEPHRFGIVQSSDGWVTSIVDKPALTGSYPMWGAVAFRQEFWSFLEDERHTLSNALNRACSHAPVFSMTAKGQYLDIGTPISFINGIITVNRFGGK